MWYWTDATEVTLCSVCAYTWPGLWLSKETRSRHCPHLPLLAKKSDILNQTLSSSKKDEPFGHKKHDNPDNTHRGTCRHAHVSKDMHTLSYPLSVFPEVMSVQFSASEIYYTVVLKDSQQLVSATQKQNMPIICWNPFILLPHLQTDLEQRHLVQMNEPVSLNNSFSFFFSSHTESSGWVEARNPHIVLSVFSSGNWNVKRVASDDCWFWSWRSRNSSIMWRQN